MIQEPEKAPAATPGESAPVTRSDGPSDEVMVVYATCPEAQARTLATVLVDAHLAACINIVPGIESVFRWQGRTQHDRETLLLIKTTRARYAELEQAIRERHPYELPEVLAVPVQAGLPAYLDWLKAATT
ncbi:MAG TPA: divalent-cation tolerance protein CutA [Nevskiaceae bacterium]|nr:divalent-cation tolerance protein CutA [Nevskiaceae bacterium]